MQESKKVVGDDAIIVNPTMLASWGIPPLKKMSSKRTPYNIYSAPRGQLRLLKRKRACNRSLALRAKPRQGDTNLQIINTLSPPSRRVAACRDRASKAFTHWQSTRYRLQNTRYKTLFMNITIWQSTHHQPTTVINDIPCRAFHS